MNEEETGMIEEKLNLPLVGAVVLVVVTVLLAGVLAYIASNIGKRPIPPEELECKNAGFEIYSGKYDAESKTIFLTLNNMKNTGLTNLIIYLVYPDRGVDQKPLESILEGNAMKTFNITKVEDGFTRGMIKTQCPNIFVNFVNRDGNLE